MKNSKSIMKMIMGTVLSCSMFSFGGNAIFAQEQKRKFVDIGQNAQVINSFSTLYNPQSKMKASLQISFINDPNSDKQIAIINTDGSNIDADNQIIHKQWPGAQSGEASAILEWASSYQIEMELKGEGAQFYKVAPTNTIDAKSVTSSVGYTVGGNIKMSDKPDGGITGGTNWSMSVTYNQPDYKTFLTSDSDKKVNWNVSFVSAMNQGYGPYDRDSNNPTFGNQLFMKSRNQSVWAKDNFLSKNQMPALASFGFSPGMIAVIIADKTITTPSDFKVTYGRTSDLYFMNWTGIGNWAGILKKDDSKMFTYMNYAIDWKNHQLIVK
ncbi:beta-channel forming cytolysin (plasmid) [Bacillus mycoides]|nr:beta-channel forming cytolysin [Bacillus mycoides]